LNTLTLHYLEVLWAPEPRNLQFTREKVEKWQLSVGLAC